jgi:hypothetical protein
MFTLQQFCSQTGLKGRKKEGREKGREREREEKEWRHN